MYLKEKGEMKRRKNIRQLLKLPSHFIWFEINYITEGVDIFCRT